MNDSPPPVVSRLHSDLWWKLAGVAVIAVLIAVASIGYRHYRHAAAVQRASATGAIVLNHLRNGAIADWVTVVICNRSTSLTAPLAEVCDATAALDSVELVKFEGVPLTDDDLMHLSSMQYVKSITLIDTQVTHQGFDAIRKRLPRTQVHLSNSR